MIVGSMKHHPTTEGIKKDFLVCLKAWDARMLWGGGGKGAAAGEEKGKSCYRPSANSTYIMAIAINNETLNGEGTAVCHNWL